MENTPDHFEKNFGYESFIPLLIFTLGIYIMYLILKADYSQAFLLMIISFLIYISNNIYLNIHEKHLSIFNEFLEDSGVFLTFGINSILFGIIFYKGDLLILFVIFYYAICTILAVARSWVLQQKNSVGFPLVLNGLFFPLTYYLYVFYLQDPGDSIFIFYYIIVGTLAVSKSNYLSYEQTIKEVIKTKKEEKLIENNEEEIQENVIGDTIYKKNETNFNQNQNTEHHKIDEDLGIEFKDDVYDKK